MPTIPGLFVSSLNNYVQNNVVATLTSNEQNSSAFALSCNTSGLPSRFQQAVPQSSSTATTA